MEALLALAATLEDLDLPASAYIARHGIRSGAEAIVADTRALTLSPTADELLRSAVEAFGAGDDEVTTDAVNTFRSEAGL